MVDTGSLRKVPLFKELDEASLVFLASHVEILEVAPNEVLYREREPGDALYIVDSGELSITKVIDWDDMSEKVLAVVGKDAFFGEMSLLDNEPRSASVKAITASRLLIVRRTNFLQLLQQSAVVATKLLLSIIKTVNSRLRQTNRQLVTLYDTGKIIGSVRDLGTMAEEIMERITETLGVKRGILILVNPYSNELETKQVTG
ncbi:MAG: cyclic nucleotide-binding domain-containing protein, partial [Candidatus Wallbacteria bacterium]|nr:cyclic nucleotide-binding domain-containing protein [Candidatus Wallbacteria bacterium]